MLCNVNSIPTKMEVYGAFVNRKSDFSNAVAAHFKATNDHKLDNRVTQFFRDLFHGFAIRCDLSENGQQLELKHRKFDDAAKDPDSTCGRCHATGIQAMCRDCHLMYYCSEDCLKNNEESHRETCNEWQSVKYNEKLQKHQLHVDDLVEGLKLDVEGLITQIQELKKNLAKLPFRSEATQKQVLKNLEGLIQYLSNTVAFPLMTSKIDLQQLMDQFLEVERRWHEICNSLSSKRTACSPHYLSKARVSERIEMFTTLLNSIKTKTQVVLSIQPMSRKEVFLEGMNEQQLLDNLTDALSRCRRNVPKTSFHPTVKQDLSAKLLACINLLKKDISHEECSQENHSCSLVFTCTVWEGIKSKIEESKVVDRDVEEEAMLGEVTNIDQLFDRLLQIPNQKNEHWLIDRIESHHRK